VAIGLVALRRAARSWGARACRSYSALVAGVGGNLVNGVAESAFAMAARHGFVCRDGGAQFGRQPRSIGGRSESLRRILELARPARALSRLSGESEVIVTPGCFHFDSRLQRHAVRAQGGPEYSGPDAHELASADRQRRINRRDREFLSHNHDDRFLILDQANAGISRRSIMARALHGALHCADGCRTTSRSRDRSCSLMPHDNGAARDRDSASSATSPIPASGRTPHQSGKAPVTIGCPQRVRRESIDACAIACRPAIKCALIGLCVDRS